MSKNHFGNNQTWVKPPCVLIGKVNYQFAYRVTRAYLNGRIGTNELGYYLQYTPESIRDHIWGAIVNRGNNNIKAGLTMQGAYWRTRWFKTH